MEFKPIGAFSQFKEHAHKLIITMDEVQKMLCNAYLLEQRSHYIVTFENTYDDSKIFQHSFFPERMKLLEQAFNQSQTIVIKDLEHWSEQIEAMADMLGKSANVHLYLSPQKGTSFGWHADDRDVFILMQKGQKLIEVEEPDGSISRHLLKVGSELFIPYGLKHRALSGDETSVHLSFGFWPMGLTIQSAYPSIPVQLNVIL